MIDPFCAKYTTFDLKKYKGVYFRTLKSHAKFEEKLTCGLENDMRNLANFHENTWKCQNWYFDGILLFTVENAWTTNYISYRRVISNDTQEWWKIWGEIDLSFQNLHKELDEFWLQNLKVSKIYTFMGCFLPNYIMFELKKYRGVMFTCTQDWYKIWKKTGLCFQKLTWRIWQIFTRALESLQIGTLMIYICLKLKMYEFKTCRGLMCHDNDKWCKIWRGTDFSFQNYMRNLTNFHPTTRKSQKFPL